MAKPKKDKIEKRTPKEASALFHSIIKASVTDVKQKAKKPKK